ncbi:queuosine salvage protein [Strongylocentrotus purpuratus]|uniref:Queuosine 5'-phosphate N-glycosylase/hydrolase n=1 Tax=Strongylocentrotus purpuratus TaxID=7668 RepID=A0A7M7HFC6_STRPU|nr:queuosine salvage protein [Strongylocentrotus purpuratus]
MSAKPLSPRESGRFIAEHCQDVTINQDAAKKVAQMIWESLDKQQYSIKSWKENALHPKTMTDATVDWIFVLDTLNFSFWSETNDKRYLVRYNNENHSGYWALCAALMRACDEGIPITSPSYYSKVTLDELRHVFRSETDTGIHLLDKRIENLHQTGKVLMEKFDGSFVNCIKCCENSAVKLIELVTSHFSSFRDVATFNGTAVSLYKRAQILVADIWACFEGQGHGCFTDIDTLTMFADYRVPQGLNYFGVLSYSDALKKRLEDETKLFTPGERLEVEIRGCSIWAVELILQEMRRIRGEDLKKGDVIVNSIIIDFYLWTYCKDHRDVMAHIPIHKIRSIYY